jgi:hypothetical protein
MYGSVSWSLSSRMIILSLFLVDFFIASINTASEHLIDLHVQIQMLTLHFFTCLLKFGTANVSFFIVCEV